jgi:hypothetical protein
MITLNLDSIHLTCKIASGCAATVSMHLKSYILDNFPADGPFCHQCNIGIHQPLARCQAPVSRHLNAARPTRSSWPQTNQQTYPTALPNYPHGPSHLQKRVLSVNSPSPHFLRRFVSCHWSLKNVRRNGTTRRGTIYTTKLPSNGLRTSPKDSVSKMSRWPRSVIKPPTRSDFKREMKAPELPAPRALQVYLVD